MSNERYACSLKHNLAEHRCTNNNDEQNTTNSSYKLKDIQSISISFSDLASSQDISQPMCSYGIDWSDHAYPTSHCWSPYSYKNASHSRLCTYISCKKDKVTKTSLVECLVCSLIIHTEHLVDLQATDNTDKLLPQCRSSFIDSNANNDINSYDQHQWSSSTSVRSQKCDYCHSKHHKSKILVCLWCSRRYHEQCWTKISEDANNNKCDYGKFGDIIVRPQWLHRVSNNPAEFHAKMSYCSTPITPVIFFINKISGGQKGDHIYRQLVRLVNPRQVFLLENDATIEKALNIYSSLVNTRICICGGDGTVGWILTRLVELFPTLKNPPASICPLGTGNDLSRVLGWGYQYNSKRFRTMLLQIPHAQPIALDRWQIHIQPLETTTTPDDNTAHHRRFLFRNHPKFIRDADLPLYDNHRTSTKTHFFNYMSFGLDAAVVLDFHARRTLDATKFTSPFKNKVLYINEARKYFNEFAFGIGWNLAPYIRLLCDDKDMTDSIRSCHSLVLLNIPGFGSGTRPWDRMQTNINSSSSSSSSSNIQDDILEQNDIIQTTTTTASTHETNRRFEIQDFGDQKIEVLGLTTIQMALIHLGFRGIRIAQCRAVRIELTHPMPVHMDGEPFYLPGSSALHVTHAGQVMVLRN